MQFIRDIYAAAGKAGKPVLSFELFPPKTDDGDRALVEKTLPALKALRPDYCSVTYGAGGSTREKTLMIVDRVQREQGIPALAHLTCVGSSREELQTLLERTRSLGVRNILALRGDPPAGRTDFRPVPGGFQFAAELVGFIRELGDFSIGVAGFPEGHIACREGKLVDWQRLKAKIDCGADFVITQLFFDNRDYFALRDFLLAQGVRVPICPGIIPILSTGQIRRFTALSGAVLPPPLLAGLERFGDDDEATTRFGIDYATRQCDELLRAGAPGIHFYTLNKVRSTAAILRNLGLT